MDPPIRASVPEIFSHVWTRTPTSYDAATASTKRERDLDVTPLPLVSDSSPVDVCWIPCTQSLSSMCIFQFQSR